ncbi:sigma-70 family RNA polymerase sigma factor [Draconibacterium sp.]
MKKLKDSKKTEQEFLELLENNKKLIFKIANVYGRNEEEIKDLVQEITLQLWKSFPNYNPKYAISTWMYRIALNVSISFYRKEKSRKRIHQELSSQPHILYWEDQKPDDKQQLLYRFIEQLKTFEKAVIVLYLEGKKYNEIADILGISATNVSTKLNRIKTKLSKEFKSLKQ